MTLSQSINRGFNLLAVGVVGLAGFAFMAEIFLEHDWSDKIDDIALLAFGVIAIFWYLSKENRYKRSFAPVVLASLSLLAKIGAMVVESSDKEAVGDDFGGLTLFILAVVFIVYQYRKSGRLLQETGGQNQ